MSLDFVYGFMMDDKKSAEDVVKGGSIKCA